MRSPLRPWLFGALAGFAAGAILGSATLGGAVAGRQEAGALEARVTALETQLESVLALAPHLSVVPDALDGLAGPHVVFEGVNVHVRSGSGRTNDFVPVGGALTGLGNLVVGYNEPPLGLAADDRRGSHTLVIGEGHRHTSWGGLVAGVQNTVNGAGASVGGGQENRARGSRPASGAASSTSPAARRPASAGARRTRPVGQAPASAGAPTTRPRGASPA
jgi:hypothetical protein